MSKYLWQDKIILPPNFGLLVPPTNVQTLLAGAVQKTKSLSILNCWAPKLWILLVEKNVSLRILKNRSTNRTLLCKVTSVNQIKKSSARRYKSNFLQNNNLLSNELKKETPKKCSEEDNNCLVINITKDEV